MGHVTLFMIYEDLCRKAVKAYLDEYEASISNYGIHSLTGMNIKELILERDHRTNLYKQKCSAVPKPFTCDVDELLKSHFAPEIKEYTDALEEAKDFRDMSLNRVNKKHEEELAKLEAEANADIAPLVAKHTELLSYKDKLNDVKQRYNITPSDVKVSSDITREEFEVLLDASIDACKSITKERGSKLMKWYNKVCDTSNVQDKFLYVIVLLVAAIFAAPVLLVLMFFSMYKNTASIYKKIDKLRIAESLMYSIDFDKFLNRKKIEELPAVDTTFVEERYERDVKELEEDNPEKALEAERAAVRENIMRLNSMFDTATDKAKALQQNTLDILKKAVDEVNEVVDAYTKDLVEFGTICNPKPVLDLNFTLGRLRDTIDIKYKLPLSNITFLSKDAAMVDFIKLMMCNALLGVKEKWLTLTVYDPVNLGADYSEFFQPDIAQYVDVKTTDFDKLLKSLKDYAQQNIKIIGKQSINEYNEASAAVGKVTREYKLLLIASGAEDILKVKDFPKFMEYSAQYGVLIWMISPTPVPNTITYTKPFDKIEDPYPVSALLFAKCIGTYQEAVANSKADSIPYIEGFANKFIPKEKYWTYSTNKGIALHFGLANGDPTKGDPIYLGDANVHALMVGATGAGKSAAINQMLATLLRMYSPKELELVMVDFKNVEFAMYTDKETQLSRLPHAKIIAGTKDGEYAISVFNYLCKEMDRRTAIFSAAGVKKLEEYNKKMAAEGTPEKCMPRILVLIDEFQVMFTEVDASIVDNKIKPAITSLSKLARFCGCHMWFTSQSMQGTLSKDIMDQFSLRVALRCSKDVSQSIIGGPQSGEIKTKFGFLNTNTNAGNDQSSTTLWRIPYASDKDIYDTMDLVENLCEECSIKGNKALFYNEDRHHYQDELLQFYADYPDVDPEGHLMVLGERTGFSLNKAPINFNFTVDDGEHISAHAFEREDILNLAMTVIDNVAKKPSAKLLVHSADADTHTLLEAEKYVDESLVDTTYPSFEFEKWVETLEGLIESRESKPREELTPIYFLAIQWEKYRGCGREEAYKLTERFKLILQKASTFDIHFIFIYKGFKEFPNFILSNCNHRICAKTTGDGSYKVMGNSRAEKLPDSLGFAIYQYGSTIEKFKIYQHTFSKTLKERELKIE